MENTYRGEMSIVAQKNWDVKYKSGIPGIEYFNSKVYNPNSFNAKRLVFLTLTLSSSQNVILINKSKDILKPYIRILRGKYGCANYVWKAESQANGSIHFHVIIDKYIDKAELQNEWLFYHLRNCFT